MSAGAGKTAAMRGGHVGWGREDCCEAARGGNVERRLGSESVRRQGGPS